MFGSVRKQHRVQLEALIGSGSYAEVWRARLKDGRVVAMKRLLPHVAREPSAITAFEREAKLLERIKHPNVPSFIGAGTDSIGPYLLIEYVPGTCLSHLLDGPVAPDMALRVIHDVLAVLETFHSLRGDDGQVLGLVHRDLSPANVLVSTHGEIKVADFGIARAHVGTHATTGFATKGTLGYMSPEQARGQPVDARSDLFSVGALLHVMLAGFSPYDQDDPRLALARARAGDVRPFSEVAPNVSPIIADIVDRALSESPADRFASAATMRAEIMLAASSTGGLASGESIAHWAQTAERQEIPAADITGNSQLVKSREWIRNGVIVAAAATSAAIAAVFATPRTASTSPRLNRSSSIILHEMAQLDLTPHDANASASSSATLEASHARAPTLHKPPSDAPAMTRTPTGAATQVTSKRKERTPDTGDKGLLDVGSEPSFAYVTVDGQRLGATPLFGIKLSAGPHRVTVSRQGLGSKSINVQIRPGEHVSKVIKLP